MYYLKPAAAKMLPLLIAFCLFASALMPCHAQAVYVPLPLSDPALTTRLNQLQARTGKPVVISSYNYSHLPYANCQNGAATPLVGTSSTTSILVRKAVVCPFGAINPQPIYVNYNVSGYGEQSFNLLSAHSNSPLNASPVTISYAVEDSAGNIYPGTFAGKRTTVMDSTGPFIGDASPIVVPAGGTFYERTMLTYVSGSTNFPVDFQSVQVNISPSTSDPVTSTVSGGASVQTCYSAFSWVGQQVTPGPAVVLQGDSIIGIMDGAVGNSPGYMRQILSGNIGLLSCDEGGTGYRTNQSAAGQVRSRMYAYATHVYIEHGTNDQGPSAGGGTTATAGANNLIGRATTEIRKAVGFGAKVILQTIMPCPAFLQGNTTVGLSGAADVPTNQVSPAQDAGRRCYNDWIRGASIAALNTNYAGAGITLAAGTPTAAAAGMTSYVELADLFETNNTGVLTRNGGYWRVPAAPYLTGTATGGTTTTLTGAGFGSTSFKDMVIKFTSGANIGLYAQVGSSSTTSIAFYSGQNAAGTGATLAAPANGDTFSVYAIYTNDFVHPSDNAVAGTHTIVASGIISAAIFN